MGSNKSSAQGSVSTTAAAELWSPRTAALADVAATPAAPVSEQEESPRGLSGLALDGPGPS